MSEAFSCHYHFSKISTTQSSECLRPSLVPELNLILRRQRIWQNTLSFQLSLRRSLPHQRGKAPLLADAQGERLQGTKRTPAGREVPSVGIIRVLLFLVWHRASLPVVGNLQFINMHTWYLLFHPDHPDISVIICILRLRK